MTGFFHNVHEGNLGIYYRGGKLLPGTVAPGLHFMLPVVHTYEEVAIGMRTEQVKNVPCGTSGGVILEFEHIEVVFRLNPALLWETVRNYSTRGFVDTWIQEPLHHELNQLCSQFTLNEIFIAKFAEFDEMLRSSLAKTHAIWAPGLEIVSVRMSKPTIPETIMENFASAAAKTTELKTITERQAVELRNVEKKRSLATMEAHKEYGVAKQQAEAEVARAAKKAAIVNMSTATEVARVREHADARAYARTQEAEANRRMLTPEFLAFQQQQRALDNTVLYWGDAIPNSIVVDEFDEGGGAAAGRGDGANEERGSAVTDEEIAFLSRALADHRRRGGAAQKQ